MSTSRDPSESFASLFEQSAGATRPQRRYQTGENVEVTIVAVARDAVFADLGGKQEGVFERMELADPEGKLRVEIGSRVSATVRGIDSATGQVKLSPRIIRGAEGEPSARVAAAGPVLVEGARVKGKVTGVERYGVFVQIEGTNGRSGRGLVPTAETATPRGSDLKKHFTVGQDVEAKILNIAEDGKIRLSISALSVDDERGHFEAFKKNAEGQGEQEAGEAKAEGGARKEQPKEKKKPEPRNFGTLGDLLGKVAPKVAATPSPQAAKSGPAPQGAQGARGNAPHGNRGGSPQGDRRPAGERPKR